MKSSYLGGTLSFVTFVCLVDCVITSQFDQTRLIGSSFGIPGVNVTHDYVVSTWCKVQTICSTLLTASVQIVGGGTSGLTVAKRLAENAAISVAVVEGGSFYEYDNGNYSQVPAYDAYFSGPQPEDIQPLVDWGIVTMPQIVCFSSVAQDPELRGLTAIERT